MPGSLTTPGRPGARDDAPGSCCLPPYTRRRHPGLGIFIAVEMAIADHPPHRSERALLTHSAPTSSI